MEFSTENAKLNLQNYFKSKIIGSVICRMQEEKESERIEDYHKFIVGLEKDVNKWIDQSKVLSSKFDLPNPAPFLEAWLKDIPQKTDLQIHEDWVEESESSATNSKIDYRICIQILLAIDVFETLFESEDLEWLKGFLTSPDGGLYKSFENRTDLNVKAVRLPTVNDHYGERYRWRIVLKESLQTSLFKLKGAKTNVDKDEFKRRLDDFYREMRTLSIYKNDINESVTCSTAGLEAYYCIYLRPNKFEVALEDLGKCLSTLQKPQN